MDINVYMRYFEAEHVCNKVKRHAAQVILLSSSENRVVTYKVIVNFFPHNDPEDFAVSYDAYYSSVLFDGPGRRSKKREEKLLLGLRDEIDALAARAGGAVRWEEPLGEARRG